jgi:hypothetical protein
VRSVLVRSTAAALRLAATGLLLTGAVATGWTMTVPAPASALEAEPAAATTGSSLMSSPTTSESSAAQGAADDSELFVPAPSVAVATVPEGLRPARLRIASIGVNTALAELGINPDGTIEVPKDGRDAGWLATGPAPGQRGPAVIAGHVDSTTGPAVFYPLRKIAVGDRVVVTRRDGTEVTFTVDGVSRFAKSQFPTDATYGPVPGPALRLITCDGRYDRSAGGYQENLVVFAS